MKSITTDGYLHKCTNQLKAGLRPFVEHEMRKIYGQDWETRTSCQIVDGAPHWDLQALLKTVLDNWQLVFDKALPKSARSLVFELKDWRNRVAHEHEIVLGDVSRYIDTAARLLKIAGAPQTDDVMALRLQVLQAEVTSGINAQETPDINHSKSQDSALAPMISRPSSRQVHVAGAPSWRECINRLSAKLGANLIQKVGRCALSANRDYGVCCLVSKEYPGKRFWWTLRDDQLQDLAVVRSAFVAFACGSPDSIVMIPVSDFKVWLPTFNPKTSADGEGWHIHILHEENQWWLLQKGRYNRVNITQYVI